MQFKMRSSLLSGIQSTAIADIVFLLLIFFLLSSSFILQTGIKIDLPKVTRPEQQERRDVIVTLTSRDEVFVDDKKVSWGSLPEILGERLAQSATKTVIMKGDASVSLGRTVDVMDMARQAGAERLALAAQPREEVKGGEGERSQ